MATDSGEWVPVPKQPAPPPWPLWRWFRLVGLPVMAVTAIVAGVLALRAPAHPSGGSTPPGGLGGDDLPQVAPRPGAAAPDFVLQTADGMSYQLRALRGHPVVINFWATWCGPCRNEMPLIEAAYRDRAADGLIVLAVNVQEAGEHIAAFASDLGLTFPIVLDADGSVTSMYGVHGLPVTFFVTPDGIVDGVQLGPLRQSVLRTRLERLWSPR